MTQTTMEQILLTDRGYFTMVTSGEWHQFAILGGILLTLGIMRIMAIRYSPATLMFMQRANQQGHSAP